MHARDESNFSCQRAHAGVVAAIRADALVNDAPTHDILHHRVIGALDMLEVDGAVARFTARAVFSQQPVVDFAERLTAGGAVAVRGHDLADSAFDLVGHLRLQLGVDVVD